ncbi:uncharacterized protein LOC124159177 isoform X2 [Ischnura elegans]|uniref:uncharacterized protein LOC124159177 isoform X2 n=1 Tax=Ischnura elegans TaxID=197161 RepID=UPI001ED8B099|nr:uncharacterized protein LOC124159177 isoform X2 [Ischnura elegans]
MDPGYQRFRGIQQTIPSMMQRRASGMSNFSNSIGPMTPRIGSPGMYCQPQNTSNTPRTTPYKVPFQRRQVPEPIYGDPAPVMMPQHLQLSSPYGLGTIFSGPSSLYIPTYQQNVMEPPNIDGSHNFTCYQEESVPKIQQEAFVSGLTSSPPNHPSPHEIVANVHKVNITLPEEKENILDRKSDKFNLKRDPSENKKEAKVGNASNKQPFDPARISLRVLTGSIEKVIKWEKMYENKFEKPNFLFEIIAPLLQMKTGSKPIEKQILLREPGSPVLTIIFYEIDRVAPQLTVGDNVRCICRPLGKRRYQAFSVRAATPKELSCVERLSFLSHRAVQEALLSTSEP